MTCQLDTCRHPVKRQRQVALGSSATVRSTRIWIMRAQDTGAQCYGVNTNHKRES